MDWSLPASDVARSIGKAGESGLPMSAYCGLFRVDMYSAQDLADSWRGTVPGTIVDHWDDGKFTVVAGDGHGVRILTSSTEFHVTRTPDIWEVVLAAGMEVPVVLTLQPANPIWTPYWKRAIFGWKTRSAPALSPPRSAEN